jgi:cell division protease FtsH
MSERIGPYYLGLGEEHVFLGREMAQERSLSDELLSRAEHASQALITEAMDVATGIVGEHRAEMDRLVERLMEEETLSREQIIETLSEAETEIGTPEDRAPRSIASMSSPPPQTEPPPG